MQLINSAFIGYEELSRSRREFPPQLSALVDNTLQDLLNSSNPTQPHSLIANYPKNHQSQAGREKISISIKLSNGLIRF